METILVLFAMLIMLVAAGIIVIVGLSKTAKEFHIKLGFTGIEFSGKYFDRNH